MSFKLYVQNHPTLNRERVESWGAAVIMQHVANEFKQASNNADFREKVIENYHHARALMGVLEMLSFDSVTTLKLAPFFRLCSVKKLFREDRLSPQFIAHFATSIGKAFEHAAQEISHA